MAVGPRFSYFSSRPKLALLDFRLFSIHGVQVVRITPTTTARDLSNINLQRRT